MEKDKKEKKVALIQVSADTHQMIKDYADHHGFKISALVSIVMRKYIKGIK